MGRKAKKRGKSPVCGDQAECEMMQQPDMMHDQDEHMLEFKRLKENGSIDIMLDELEGDPASLDAMEAADLEGHGLSSSSHSEACNTDSDIIKSDIFDPAFEMHQNLVSSMGEYGAAFLNGMDGEGVLEGVKQETGSLPSLVTSDLPHTSVALADSGATLSPMHTKAPSGGPHQQLPQPTQQQQQQEGAEEGEGAVSEGPSVTALPSVIPAAIPISPLFLPSAVASLGGPSSTALAHISKIEPGADGKGYVLHLTIPALGLGNVMLSTEGLTFAHPDPKLASPAAANVPGSPSTEADGAFSPGGSMDQAPSPDDININVDTDSPSPVTHYPSEDNMADTAPHDLDLQEPEVKVKQGLEEDMFSGSSLIVTPSVSSSSSSSHLVCEEQVEPPCGGEQSMSGCEVDVVSTDRGQGALAGELAATVVEHNTDRPEVDRFVICSDGPMVCVLCAFKTDSYSAFKSHIICSHPCWRITKKLSKNRLLVEKSVKMNTSLVHTNFNMPPSICNRKAGEQSGGAGGGGGGGSPTTNTSQTDKLKKPSTMHPRKKQLIERNKRLFRCTKCLRLFVFEGSIVNHLMDYHGLKKPYDYIMVSNDHGHSFGNIHRCSHKNCFVTCTSEVELERHRLESHAQVVFRCQICGYTADNAQAIKAHAVRIHHQQIREYGHSD